MDEEDGADCLRIRTMSHGKNISVNSYFSYAAHDRLAGRPRGPYRKLRILQAWAEGAGRTSSIFDVSLSSSAWLRLVAVLMLGEPPVNRVEAYYEKCHRRALRNFCNSYFCKRACVSIVFSSMIL